MTAAGSHIPDRRDTDVQRHTDTSSDLECIERFRAGDVRGFNELVTRYRERIYWVARRMMGSHDDADDVVQEVFVRAYEHLAAFRSEAGVYTWLYRITVNVSLNMIQRRKVKEFLKVDEILETFDTGEGTADAPLLQQEYETLLEQAIATLPTKQKMVFIMKYYDEIPFEDMAVMLKKSVGGLKANYFHAVQKIRIYMRKAMDR